MLVLDGGLSTVLEQQGHDLSDRLWSARLLRDDPSAIVAAHASFYDAGADVAITASYQASFEGFATIGVDAAGAGALLRASVTLAREAAALAGRPDALVAASVGPYGAVLAGGQEYTGEYAGITAAALNAFHAPRLAALAAGNPDLFAVETIPRADEAGAIATALAGHPHIPAWVSFCCRDAATTCGGDTIERAVLAALAAPNLAAVGVNCTAPAHVEGLLTRIRAVAPSVPLVVYPNAGRSWDADARSWSGPPVRGFPRAMVDRWLALGATYVGGCCGVDAAAIADLRATVRRRSSRTP